MGDGSLGVQDLHPKKTIPRDPRDTVGADRQERVYGLTRPKAPTVFRFSSQLNVVSAQLNSKCDEVANFRSIFHRFPSKSETETRHISKPMVGALHPEGGGGGGMRPFSYPPPAPKGGGLFCRGEAISANMTAVVVLVFGGTVVPGLRTEEPLFGMPPPPRVHLVNGTGNSPVSGTADPRSSQTGHVIRGLR